MVTVTGMVIKSFPSGETDKRLLLLTRERGKITAFARGAKRPGSQLMAPSRPFAFGKFFLSEGRDAFNLQSAEITSYFEDLAADLEGACYGSYFLELADFYARENMDATEFLLLLYKSLKALLKPALPNVLIQRIFELRSMVINGEYTEHPPKQVCESAVYTWEFVIASPVENLYTFVVSDQVLEEFSQCVELNKKKYMDKEFHSLEILKTMIR